MSEAITANPEAAPVAQPAAATPAPTAAPDWRGGLAPEFQTHPSLKDIKDINGLAKSYISAQSMIGAEKIVLPKADAKPEEWDGVYSKLGRPESPDKYKLPDVQALNLPKDVGVDEQVAKNMLGVFHKAGLSQKQAETVYSEYLKLQGGKVAETLAAREKANTEAVEKLKGEWGQEYEERLNKANLAYSKFQNPELEAVLDEYNLRNHPAMVKHFYDNYTKMSEDRADGRSNEGFATTQEQATEQLKALSMDQEFQKALNDSTHAGHKAAVEKRLNLFRIAHPGKSS